MLLCLNSEWQGSGVPDLERGARELARDLFGSRPYLDLGPSGFQSLDSRDGVYALDSVVERFGIASRELECVEPERIVTVGGTCGSEAAPVAYLACRYPGLGIVWLDAHGDLNTPATSRSGHFHGMVLRTLLGQGPAGFADRIACPLEPDRVVVAGVRDLDPPEREYAVASGLALIEGWPPDVIARISESLRSAGVSRLYVHVDVDVFDPEDYGDALFSVPGGPSLREVAQAVRSLVDSFDVAGVGVVESRGREPEARRKLVAFMNDSGLLPVI
ncbi:MAG TPA: arginase [Coriobacteriia bacterium]|nr:arginase [Coriobacteriia bacterium]